MRLFFSPKAKYRCFVGSLVQLALIGSLAGCYMAGTTTRMTQTHYTYPNSNVLPTKSTKGSSSSLCGLGFFMWRGPGGAEADEAIDEAVANGGGDLMINAKLQSGMWYFPIGALVGAGLSAIGVAANSPGLAAGGGAAMTLGNFYVCSSSVTGTGAKMEIGLQELHPIGHGNSVSQPAVVGPPMPRVDSMASAGLDSTCRPLSEIHSARNMRIELEQKDGRTYIGMMQAVDGVNVRIQTDDGDLLTIPYFMVSCFRLKASDSSR